MTTFARAVFFTLLLCMSSQGLAMPLVGGTGTWMGPVIGALLMGLLHQIVTVMISSDYNLLIAGIVLICFVILAPGGIMGLIGHSRKNGGS